MSDSNVDLEDVLLTLASWLTYIMAIARWLFTEHDSFWHGFKELLWALCPILNIAYVWDWWLSILLNGVRLALYVMQAVLELDDALKAVGINARTGALSY